MSSRRQRKANYRNSLLSTGPKAESLEHTRFNGVTHGARARTTVLPRENLEAYNRMVEDWNGDCRPRTPAERALVLEIANAQWKLQRVESAQDERVAAGIGDAGTREDVAVFKKMERLFWDPRGPLPRTPCGPWPMAGRRLRFPGKSMTLIIPTCWSRTWRPLRKGARLFWTNGQFYGAGRKRLPWQPQDRFAAVRMLGKHPVDAALDRRVRLIYITTFALNPLGKKDPYEDLKSDMVTIDFDNFVNRIQSRWPQELFTNDFEKAKAMLLDLIARVVERLEGIRDAHLRTRKRSRRRPRSAWRSIPRRRASGWHATRCSATGGFINAWTHSGSTEGKWSGRRKERTKIRRNTTWCGQRNGRVLEYLSRNENKNVTTEANPVPDALEVEANQGVLGTGKAFKLADAGVAPGVDGGDRGGGEAISTPVVGERAVLEAVEGEIQSSEPPMRRDC